MVCNRGIMYGSRPKSYLDLVVTAFPNPWSTQSPNSLLHHLTSSIHQNETFRYGDWDLMKFIMKSCVDIQVEPGAWGLQDETWVTIFEKSIYQSVRLGKVSRTNVETDFNQGSREEELFKQFSTLLCSQQTSKLTKMCQAPA